MEDILDKMGRSVSLVFLIVQILHRVAFLKGFLT